MVGFLFLVVIIVVTVAAGDFSGVGRAGSRSHAAFFAVSLVSAASVSASMPRSVDEKDIVILCWCCFCSLNFI